MTQTVEDPEAQLGRRVKELRNARGWSQEKLARGMKARGHSWFAQTVTKVETGHRTLKATEAAAVAWLLGVAVDDLFTVAPGGEVEVILGPVQLEAKLAELEARIEALGG